MAVPRIIVNNLSFHIDNTAVAFRNISLAFANLKYGIVGNNGIGKTTFLKLLSTELSPSSGSIHCDGSMQIVPQSHVHFPANATVRDVLGVTDITQALERIHHSCYAEDDLAMVVDHWNIAERIQAALDRFNLEAFHRPSFSRRRESRSESTGYPPLIKEDDERYVEDGERHAKNNEKHTEDSWKLKENDKIQAENDSKAYDFDQPFSSLSGGQKTKILLAKTLIFPTDFILFDEPTNNLDKPSRDILYHYIESCPKGIILVSHDRTLLNKMDHIIEITSHGFEQYGGSYDFYREQKAIKLQAMQQDMQTRLQSLQKSQQTIQTRMERHQQNESKGKKAKKAQINAKGRYDKITFKSQQGRSEKTNRRIRIQATRKLEGVKQNLHAAKKKLDIDEPFNMALSATAVPNSKIILHIEDLTFSYPNHPAPLINRFNLQLIGPTRIAITGANGCGKSTLIKLIQKKLLPLSGTIQLNTPYVAYLDQEVSYLDKNLTLVENFLRLNPEVQPFDAYSALAAFKFRNNAANKKVAALSGGERMRAGLAISLMTKHPPQLIILDEPTNHLDLNAIEAIEAMLKLYQGALLAVSHDAQFLENIGIQKMIVMYT